MSSKRQPPPAQADTVPIRCAAGRCPAVTHVDRRHADNLRGRWHCRDHYRGAFPMPDGQARRS